MNIYYENKGYEVPPKSSMDIHKNVQAFRLLYGDYVDKNGKIDISAILEFEYGNYDIKDIDEMPGIYGKTTKKGVIQLRKDVYEKALRGDGQSRSIIAHEFGHAFLHIDDEEAFAKEANSYTPIYKNSEWQANEFSGMLLLPPELLHLNENKSDREIMQIFGISNEMLAIRKNKQKRLWEQIKTLTAREHC